MCPGPAASRGGVCREQESLPLRGCGDGSRDRPGLQSLSGPSPCLLFTVHPPCPAARRLAGAAPSVSLWMAGQEYFVP